MASVATEVAPDRGERLLIWVGFPLVGAVAGGLVKALAGWAASWEWVPAHDALRLMASLRNPWGKVGLAVLGALAGAGVAFLAERDHVRVTVDDDQVTLVRDGVRDPYRQEYRRWVEDHPDLPAGLNGLLKARARALEQDDREDLAELDGELAGLGVVLREVKRRQYWRRVRTDA